MSYTQEISRVTPGCIMFLVDQSGSMAEPFAGDETTTKMDGVATAVNRILLELILKSVKDHDEGPRHYFDIGLITYGAEVGSAFGGSLAGRDLVSIAELTENPLEPEQPIWLAPKAEGRTPMGEAINQAGRILAGWANEHLDSFPPIVINISDGAATDEADVWVQRLTSIHTEDGALLFFNLNVGRFRDEPVMFPSSVDEVPNEYAAQLFEYSSQLPPAMLQEASRSRATPLAAGARGFGYNGDFHALTDFLVTGTQVSLDRAT
ncbi:MAG: VWA domain-containing protein [Acidimicrobiales bacterium]